MMAQNEAARMDVLKAAAMAGHWVATLVALMAAAITDMSVARMVVYWEGK